MSLEQSIVYKMIIELQPKNLCKIQYSQMHRYCNKYRQNKNAIILKQVFKKFFFSTINFTTNTTHDFYRQNCCHRVGFCNFKNTPYVSKLTRYQNANFLTDFHTCFWMFMITMWVIIVLELYFVNCYQLTINSITMCTRVVFECKFLLSIQYEQRAYALKCKIRQNTFKIN